MTVKLSLMKRLLPFLLLLLSSTTLAESGAYRVEVIVFLNLKSDAEITAIQELRSFSQYPDLEKTRLPDDLIVLEQRTAYMDDVWRRLRSSNDYRPLVYAAWEQNRTDYYPPMRIHDQNVIDTQLRPPTHIMVADLAATDPLAAYRNTFYQLDGSVQLKRSRFLHLLLDLEYRVEKTAMPAESDYFTDNNIQTEIETGTDRDIVDGVFTLKQNRQIRSGQVQYFDTPFWGVLVFVSAISAK